MKKIIMMMLLVALVCTGVAPRVFGQFGFPSVNKPNIANIFHPVVGAGTSYEETDRKGKKSVMEMSIVGKEMVGTQQGYWMEIGHTEEDSKDLAYVKTLVTPDDYVFHKSIFMMPGSTQPMEMDMSAAKPHREVSDKNMAKWHLVGTETITVPAGTFSCEHWTEDGGKGDTWMSPKVSPMGLVKEVENGTTTILMKVITDAKSHITGTPKKFDAEEMKRQMMEGMQKQSKP